MKKSDELSAEQRYNILKAELDCNQSDLNRSNEIIKGCENQINDVKYRIKKEKKERQIFEFMVSVLKPLVKEMEKEVEKEKKEVKGKEAKKGKPDTFVRIDPMPC